MCICWYHVATRVVNRSKPQILMARSVFVFSPKMSGGFGRFFSPPNCRLFSVVFLLLWAVERNRPKETESVFWFRFFWATEKPIWKLIFGRETRSKKTTFSVFSSQPWLRYYARADHYIRKYKDYTDILFNWLIVFIFRDMLVWHNGIIKQQHSSSTCGRQQ